MLSKSMNFEGIIPMSAVSCGVERRDFGADVAASIRQNLAGNLRALLKIHKLNQRQFASAIGVDESLVSNWLHEKNFPSEDALNKIVDTFGWSFLRALLSGDAGLKPDSKSEARLAREKRALIDAARRLLDVAEEESEPEKS